MLKRTEKETEDFVRAVWGDDVEDVKVTAREDRVDIRMSNMYSAPGLNLKKLKALAEFFGTDNIDDEDQFSSGGCESCDYGSTYGFTLTIRPDES